MNKSIPTIEELSKDWLKYGHTSKFLQQEIQPLLDRLAEAEKPRTLLDPIEIEESLKAYLYHEPTNVFPWVAKILWPLIQSHAVVPEGLYAIGQTVESRGSHQGKWCPAVIYAFPKPDGPCTSEPSNVRSLPPTRPLINSEKLAKLIPEVPAEKCEAMLKHITQENLDAMCLERGIALET